MNNAEKILKISHGPHQWTDLAAYAIRLPRSKAKCPFCTNDSVSIAWHLVNILPRRAQVDLSCETCNASQSVEIALSDELPPFYPEQRQGRAITALKQQASSILGRARDQVKSVPAADFIMSSLWEEACWNGTTFRCHPAGAAPPVMGLCFEKALPAQELFSRWSASNGNAESLWVSIIEGDIVGQQPGYSIHLSINPQNVFTGLTLSSADLDAILLALPGRINRMHPLPGSRSLLSAFKRDFKKHKEFLLAPVTRRDQSQLWVDVELGIVSNGVHFRSATEIGKYEIDTPVVNSFSGTPAENQTGK